MGPDFSHLNMPLLNLKDYAQDIALFEPFQPNEAQLSPQEKEEVVDYLLSKLTHITKQVGTIPAGSYAEKRRLLHAALNMLEPNFLSDGEIARLDALLETEKCERPIISSSAVVKRTSTEVNRTIVGLWRGDITTLQVDAIVNAANSQLLGCFQPLHSCIDNAIHTKAGVQLRDDCQTIMQKQAEPEPTGQAKITRAYNLPSHFVLHTVGPIVQGTLTPRHEADLQNAYTSCLDLAAEVKQIKSIAFCCISTGVFGYPQDKAAGTAFKTVCDWLEQNPGRFDHIIFNVFTDQDRVLYESLMR